jgi:hypothetical protein
MTMAGPMLEPDEAVEWHVIESTLLRDFESWAQRRGADEAQIDRMRNLYAQLLQETHLLMVGMTRLQ